MSGIVRRQPLATTNNTTGSHTTNNNAGNNRGFDNVDTVATIISNPHAQGNKVMSATNQNAQRISFYPTNPHR